MYALGLTGSIGMGKSTVAKMFVENGLRHWDADLEVHRLYGWEPRERETVFINGSTVQVPDPGPQLRARMREEFGDILESVPCGKVDRQKLRARVDSDPTVLARLPNILAHELHSSAYATSRTHEAILYDVPLLFEGSMDGFLKTAVQGTNRGTYHTVVVSCPPDMQRERVLARPGMTQERLDVILARQMPDEEKRARADFIIDTSQSLSEVQVQVNSLCTKLKLAHG